MKALYRIDILIGTVWMPYHRHPVMEKYVDSTMERIIKENPHARLRKVLIPLNDRDPS